MTEQEAARVRQIVRDHFDADLLREGNAYVRSTETWFGRCPNCLMWVRDGHADMEADVGLWVGLWAERNSASTKDTDEALVDYRSATRDVFGVETEDDLDAPCDHQANHKQRCEPIIFRLAAPQRH
jgi:hypothetical protein